MPHDTIDLREERKRVWAEAWALTENWGLGDDGKRVLFDNLLRKMNVLDDKIRAGVAYKKAIEHRTVSGNVAYLQASAGIPADGIVGPRTAAVLTGATAAQMFRFDVGESIRPVCPCGYSDECPIHCDNGHETGDCPSHERRQMDAEYSQLRDLWVKTGDTDYLELMLECVYSE